MTEMLKKAFEKAQQLPEDAQDALAASILEAIEEREWEAIISKPHVQQKLLNMAEEAWQEHEAGETEEGGFAIL